MTRRLARLAALAAILLVTTGAGPAQGECRQIRVPYVSISSDSGATFLPYRGKPPDGYFLTFGLAAAGSPGLIYMHAADTFWVSEDDGCSWDQFGPVTSGLVKIASGPGNLSYAWPVNGGDILYSLAPSTKGKTAGFAADPRGTPESTLQGFGVDPSDSLHVRTIGRLGQIYESFDGGGSWRAIGVQASPGGSVIPYFGFFDPGNLDHVVYGQSLEGGFVTFDGGQTWAKSSGLSSGRVNFFNAVISPLDGAVVFGMALDLEEDLAGAPSQGRHIYVSTDGGLTFTPVLDHLSDGVFLQNGPLMVADPLDPGVLHFVFSSRPAFGGTTFYRYDRISGALVLTPNPTIPQVRSMTFPQGDTSRLLAGFEFVP